MSFTDAKWGWWQQGSSISRWTQGIAVLPLPYETTPPGHSSAYPLSHLARDAAMSTHSLFRVRHHIWLFVSSVFSTPCFLCSQIPLPAEANPPPLNTPLPWAFSQSGPAQDIWADVLGLLALSHHQLCPLSSKDITAAPGTTSPLWKKFTVFSVFLLPQRRRSNVLGPIQVQPHFIKGNKTLEGGVNLKSLFMSHWLSTVKYTGLDYKGKMCFHHFISHKCSHNTGLYYTWLSEI